MAKYPIPFGRHLLLLERINVGGMAEVFRAKAFGIEGFERFVAVKRILPRLAADAEFVAMFIDEARIAAQLTHQNIVQIYELGKHAGLYFSAMEYVAGRDLRQILDRQKRLGTRIDPMAASFIVSKVCEALDYAHRKRDPAGRALGIIHRDVTPQNVIVSYQGEIKLCDFGIAKAATRLSRTQVGVLKGKFAYMAPEQVDGLQTDHRTDIWALGIIFYEMLTGERLFLGDSDYATLEAVRATRIPDPTTFNPDLPPALERVVLRMLARDRNERYTWAAEVAEDLHEAMVACGRLYRSRHLRAWMQHSYEGAIRVENAKVESFLPLRRPTPKEVDEQDEAVDDEVEGPDVDPTAHFPALPAAVAHALRGSGQASAPELAAHRPAGPLGESPVSSLFGPAQLEEGRSSLEPAPSMVRPAGRDALYDATIFDSFGAEAEDDGDAANDAGETAIDDGETWSGEPPLAVAVGEAPAEIRQILWRPPAAGTDDLPALTEAGDAATIGGDDTEDDTVLPANGATAYLEGNPGRATVESVFDVGEETPDSRGPRFELPTEAPIELPTAPFRSRQPSAPLAAAPTSSPGNESTVAWLPEESPAPATGPRLALPADAAALGDRRPVLAAAIAGVALLLVAASVLLFRPRDASLKVMSQPVTGARVILDGTVVGQTPLRIPSLTLGQHRVQLQAAGFHTYTQTIDIHAARPHTMMVPLEAMPAPTAAPSSPTAPAGPRRNE